jgi:hypothetical protein
MARQSISDRFSLFQTVQTDRDIARKSSPMKSIKLIGDRRHEKFGSLFPILD